jgi:uncharacterized protein
VLPTRIAEAIRELRRRLEDAFGARLLRVLVFGSVARGEATEDSDVDVFVLLEAPTSEEIRRAIDFGGQIALDYGLPIAPLVMSKEQWDTLIARERALPREIERDGVSP